jgi:hypothetical protein
VIFGVKEFLAVGQLAAEVLEYAVHIIPIHWGIFGQLGQVTQQLESSFPTVEGLALVLHSLGGVGQLQGFWLLSKAREFQPRSRAAVATDTGQSGRPARFPAG